MLILDNLASLSKCLNLSHAERYRQQDGEGCQGRLVPRLDPEGGSRGVLYHLLRLRSLHCHLHHRRQLPLRTARRSHFKPTLTTCGRWFFAVFAKYILMCLPILLDFSHRPSRSHIMHAKRIPHATPSFYLPNIVTSALKLRPTRCHSDLECRSVEEHP